MPPNFLVGSGATDFAYENRIPVLPHDALIADGAKQRWQRWSYELRHAEMVARKKSGAQHQIHNNRYVRHPAQFHPAQLIATPCTVVRAERKSADSRLESNAADTQAPSQGQSQNTTFPHPNKAQASGDEHANTAPSAMDVDSVPGASTTDSRGERNPSGNRNTDNVSDTVGAIAVDSYGNIAAGSSSGGIGMKHPGRVGPAALLGIGTAVIPADPNDPDKVQVGAVTSGTGEHIATTMAANTCALRIYYSQRKCADGLFEEVTEDEAMRGMITTDFLGKGSLLENDASCLTDVWG